MKSFLRLNGWLFAFTALIIAVSLSSCVNTRKAVYFNNIKDTSIVSSSGEMEPIIQKSDLLGIVVSSASKEANELYNAPNGPTPTTTTGGSSISAAVGYVVNSDGFIDFPQLGLIKAAGYTKKQLSAAITKIFLDKQLLVKPSVTISFLNYRVTVLGEVMRPTVITVANERISLLEAIGLAGDLTIYAKRDNVMVIREENGVRIIKRLNLNTKEIFTSPYYFLKTNDIVYVEPNASKVSSVSRGTQLYPIVISALSFLIIVVDRVIR
ncbi:MAG: polysaccharide biosynthesis/export family protein [Chitinophagaceae bacterium]